MIGSVADYNPKKVYKYLIDTLTQLDAKYEIHEFESGAIMFDIWHNNSFYVVQIDTSYVGISKVDNETVGFDTIPDSKFFGMDQFVNKIEEILN